MVLIIWLLLGQSFAFALARAISVLAVSSPCVLALAASAAIMSGASVGAKHGIVFKTAASLQSIGTLHTAVLDKAGTITNGEPEVVTIVGTRSVPAKFLLGMAAGLESQSQDPLARAVMRKAAAENIKLSAVKDVTILDGQGLTGKMAGKVMAGGSAEFIAAQCELTPDLQQAGEQLAADGIVPLYFSLDGHAAGLIGVADAVKPASKAALDALKALGLDVILLTGDSRTNADRVAAQVGLDDAHVVSGLAPAELEAELRRLQTNGPAAMIGSTSAAAALACADVGIGMGAAARRRCDAASGRFGRCRCRGAHFPRGGCPHCPEHPHGAGLQRAAAAAGRRCALPAELCAAPDRFRHSYDAVCGVAAVRHGPAEQH